MGNENITSNKIESTLIVTQHAIKAYAEAVENNNPVYFSKDDSAKLGFSNVIAPASFLGQYNQIKTAVGIAGWVPPGAVHTKQEFQFMGVVQAGDHLQTSIETINKVDNKGREYLEYATTVTNQKGEIVCKGVMTNMIFK